MDAFQKGTPEWAFFAELFDLCKNYYDVQNDPKYFFELTHAIQVIYDKYRPIDPKLRIMVEELLNAYSIFAAKIAKGDYS